MHLILIFSSLLPLINCQTLEDVPWDSSYVVFAYYNNDTTCSEDNIAYLEVRNPTECYEQEMYECLNDGTFNYTTYSDSDCTTVNTVENINITMEGCQMSHNNVYYRYYCYDSDVPKALNPYRTLGYANFPYYQEIFQDEGDIENCTADPAMWSLIRVDTCVDTNMGDYRYVWDYDDADEFNIITYNGTDCSDDIDEETIMADDCFRAERYGYGITFDATTDMPTMNPTLQPTRDPTISPTRNPTKNPTMSPTRNPTMPPTRNPTRNPSESPTRYPTESFNAEFSTNFELTEFPCSDVDELEEEPEILAHLLENGYKNYSNDDYDGFIIIDSIEDVGGNCNSNNDRRLLQRGNRDTDLRINYTTYCSSSSVCLDLEDDTDAELLSNALVDDLEDLFDIDDLEVVADSVSTSAVTDSDGDTVKKKNNDNGYSAGARAGIAIAVVFIIILIGGFIWYANRQKDKRNGHSQVKDEIEMNANTSGGGGTNTNDNQGENESSDEDILMGDNFKPTPKQPINTTSGNGNTNQNTNDNNGETNNTQKQEEEPDELIEEEPKQNMMFDDDDE